MSCHRTTLHQLLADALEPSQQDRLAGLLVQLLERLGAAAERTPASWPSGSASNTSQGRRQHRSA
jgi:hypothetical protein